MYVSPISGFQTSELLIFTNFDLSSNKHVSASFHKHSPKHK